MMTSSLTQDSGIHTMSSKKDSAFYDSLSLPYYNNMHTNGQLRKTNSDCLPQHNYYQSCSDVEQLKVRSCDLLPKCIQPRNVIKESDLFNYPTNLDNRKQSCCEELSGVSQYSWNLRVPTDPGGGI